MYSWCCDRAEKLAITFPRYTSSWYQEWYSITCPTFTVPCLCKLVRYESVWDLLWLHKVLLILCNFQHCWWFVYMSCACKWSDLTRACFFQELCCVCFGISFAYLQHGLGALGVSQFQVFPYSLCAHSLMEFAESQWTFILFYLLQKQRSCSWFRKWCIGWSNVFLNFTSLLNIECKPTLVNYGQ